MSKQRTAVLTSPRGLGIEPRTETRLGQGLKLGDRLNVPSSDRERSSPWNVSMDWDTLQSGEAYLQEAGIVFDYIKEPTYYKMHTSARATTQLNCPTPQGLRPQIAGGRLCAKGPSFRDDNNTRLHSWFHSYLPVLPDK